MVAGGADVLLGNCPMHALVGLASWPVSLSREMGFDPGVFDRFDLPVLCAATP